MENSGFFRMDSVQKNVAEGCDPIRDNGDRVTGWKRNIYSFPPVGSPDGGAHVTAGDLNRFLYAVREGRLLSPELTETFLTPQVHHSDRGEGTQKFGYGLWFALDRSENVVFFQKEGINAGVSGLIRHYPQRDVTVVMLSNMEDGVWEPIGKVDEIIAGSGFDGS